MQSNNLIKITAVLFTGFFIASCGLTVVSNQAEENMWQQIDSVTVYQDDPSDSIPKDKIIYRAALGNIPDSLKPRLDLVFSKDSFHFPYYFPTREQLRGEAGKTISTIENENVQSGLRTFYTSTYDKDGRLVKYDISGPSTIYSAGFVYDNQNRIEQITDGWKKINISYSNFDNIETITETDSAGQTKKTLRFTYTYATFPQN